jgi:hypothetical protein
MPSSWLHLSIDRHPAKTVFTRFVPPISADKATGMWRDYYRKWQSMTLEQMDRRLVDVVPELERFIPPHGPLTR